MLFRKFWGGDMSETVIASDVRMVGDLETSGDVEVRGSVQGSIRCRNLDIDEKAHLTGSAIAERVVVRGKVEGDICGARVQLTNTADVDGSIVYGRLNIDADAFFSGKSKRVENIAAEMGLPKAAEEKTADTPIPAGTTAKDTKTDGSKAEDAKTEDTQAKDAKADGPKADDTKAA